MVKYACAKDNITGNIIFLIYYKSVKVPYFPFCVSTGRNRSCAGAEQAPCNTGFGLMLEL